MSDSPQLSASLLRLKLLDALRNGDINKIDTIVDELTSCKPTLQTQEIVQLKETILHYAVQVASLATIQHLVNNCEKYSLDINAQDTQGNTPLHLAASSSRLDVVKYLLLLPTINDTIVNLDRKQPVEVCKDTNIAQLMQFERAKFVEKAATNLRIYFSNRDFDNLENILIANPRASELLDINGTEPQTGNTVLHEFIKKDDLAMCDWILKHGGDPFKRDKHGKLPIDLVNSKNEALKKLLKAASKDQTIMDPVATTNNAIKTGGAPVYKGYLRKWTNFASGYKLRYFVLDHNGILSYYTNQDDTNNSCRGSLNLGYATLHLDSSEKLKFEIYGKNGLRWHLKANHPIETNRWVWTLQNAITIAKDNIKKRNLNGERRSTPSPATIELATTNETDTQHEHSNEPEKKRHRLRIPGRKKHKRISSLSSFESGDESTGELSRSSTFKNNLKDIKEGSRLTGISTTQGAPFELLSTRKTSHEDQYSYQETDNENFDYDIDDYDAGDYDSETEASVDIDQLNDSIATTRRSLQVELTSLLELMKSLQDDKLLSNDDAKVNEICVIGGNTIKGIHDLMAKYDISVDARYGKLKKNLDRQLEVNALWERSIRQLENEIAEKDSKLAHLQGQRKQLKKYFTTSSAAMAKSAGTVSPAPSNKNLSNEEKQPENKQALTEVLREEPDETQIEEVDEKLDKLLNIKERQVVEEAPQMPGALPDEVIEKYLGEDSDEDDEFFDADEFEEDGLENVELGGVAAALGAAQAKVEATSNELPANEEVKEEEVPLALTEEQEETPSIVVNEEATSSLNLDEKSSIAPPTVIENKEAEVLELDEKLVAPSDVTKVEETNNVEERVSPLTVEELKPAAPVEPQVPGDEGLTEVQRRVNHLLQEEGSFLGYENPPRKKLSMDEDNRPKVGLWGILKSMVGKDMTRMTLPVSFNEPTSLLQRLAEDIEYNSLLNTAAGYDDSTLRLIYVATFAATEYSSTIDRIAKPFNPLLGETFEYSRPDQNFRLFVEQVSHHPPISACRAESPKWDYYGENAVDSKFYGRSFDFKHLGKMFCVIRPDKGVRNKNGELVEEELYSWKKVNTAVVGIMLGNPTVDNYGKMVVENHTTGDIITVDLKQRGWRASSAYQLSGHALDRDGVAQWAMGGHWNSKIFAKKIVNGNINEGQSGNRKMSLLDDPNARAGTSTTVSNDPYSGSKFLVWQVAPRPKVPFNLTAFAVTLNGLDDKLKPWLPPTDTRLRPDQRDMEEGLYDRAADEKHRVEVKQRQARKQREDNKETYVPNWFVKRKHPVTGDMFWEYNGKYWPRRKAQDLANTGDIF